MKEQHLQDDMYRRFEALLSCSVNDRHIDWEKVLLQTESRITKAERLGILAILKQIEIPNEEIYQNIEMSLQKRILEYSEYESPINECIRIEESLPDNQWGRIETKLTAAIEELDSKEDWQAVLKEEKMLSSGSWEKLEQNFFERINDHGCKTKKVIAWPTWWLFIDSFRYVRSVAALMVLVIIGIAGFLHFSPQPTNLLTYVYQAQGSDFDLVGNIFQNDYLQSSIDGAIRVVNKHGFACLQNGAAVQVEEMNDKSARYSIAMTGESGGVQEGKATFFVTRQTNNRTFTVKTPDYEISVLGTYFTVVPDLGGRVGTQVMEGKVRIKNSEFGDTVIAAGQSLLYDENQKRYIIRNNGPVLSRSEIDRMPNVETIHRYQPVTLSSNIPYADVIINGKYRGSTPLRVLLPQGSHSVRINKDDYVAVDTTMVVGKSATKALYAVLKEPEPVLSRIPVVDKKEIKKTEKEKTITSDTIEKLLVQDQSASQVAKAKELLQQAQETESRNWSKALEVYTEIMEMEHAPSIVRESALFSIGRLKVENANEKREAREAFLSYLALYPDGLFTRESLLRLAELEFEIDQNKAIEYYLKYFEKYPNHYKVSDLQYRVGLIYLQKRRYDEAVYMIKQSLSNMLHDQAEEKQRRYNSLYRALMEKGDTTNANLVKQY